MANRFREKTRKFKAVITRLFTGCRSASNVDVVDMPRQEEMITTAASVQVQDDETELNVHQRAQLIVQGMLQQGLSYNDFDYYMERHHQDDLAVRARTEVPISQHALESLLSTGPIAPLMLPRGGLAAPARTVPTAPVPPRGDVVEPAHTKVAVGTGPTESSSVPNAPTAPWSHYTINGVAIPPNIQAVFTRITEMEANMGRILGGDVALPHRKELPVFEVPTNPTFPPELSLRSAPARDKFVPVRPKAVTGNGVVRATEDFKDVDSFMDKVIASMAPGSSSATSVQPAKAKPALARAKVALCISDLDKNMDKLYSNMTGQVRTSLPAFKLPIALGTAPTAPRVVPIIPSSALKSVQTGPRATGAPINTLDGPSVMPRRCDIPVFQPGGASSDSRPILPAGISPVKPAPHTVQPSDMVTSVAIPKRWDIPVFMPAGASSDPRLIMPPGTSLIPPPGASSAPSAPHTVLPSIVAGMSKFQFAEYLMEQMDQGVLSPSEVDSLIDNFNANSNEPASEASTSQTSAQNDVMLPPVQANTADTTAFSFSAAVEPSDAVHEVELGLIPTGKLSPLHADVSLA